MLNIFSDNFSKLHNFRLKLSFFFLDNVGNALERLKNEVS